MSKVLSNNNNINIIGENKSLIADQLHVAIGQCTHEKKNKHNEELKYVMHTKINNHDYKIIMGNKNYIFVDNSH